MAHLGGETGSEKRADRVKELFSGRSKAALDLESMTK
jgi:hypothetical protein